MSRRITSEQLNRQFIDWPNKRRFVRSRIDHDDHLVSMLGDLLLPALAEADALPKRSRKAARYMTDLLADEQTKQRAKRNGGR